MEQTVYLQLEDGTCLTGKHFGAPLKEDVIAEVVFTTAMTGYTETLTAVITDRWSFRHFP